MNPSTSVDKKTHRYEVLKQLYASLQQDHAELAQRYAMVKKKITGITNENEFLVDELCRYTESDFDSDSDTSEIYETTKRLKTEHTTVEDPNTFKTESFKVEPAA